MPHPSRLAAVMTLVAVLSGACSSGDPTPEPTPTPSPTPRPSPSPSPSPVAGPPAPLTGVPVDDESVLQRPPVIVKIENSPAARPQSGLADADVVYEELVEGGVTRFLSVFHSTTPETVGPIRSARFVDADVAPAFRALFVFSGARDEVTAALRRADLVLQGEDGTTLYREPSRSAPHNLYATGESLFDKASSAEPLRPPTVPWVFDEEPPDGGRLGADIEIRMSNASRSGWSYDRPTGTYRRAQNGTPFEVTGARRVGAANVVIVGVTVANRGCCDTSGSPYVETVAVGEGRAVILRDGRIYEATWRKPAPDDHIEFLLPDGEPFPLAPGPSWIHLTPVANLPAPPS